MFISPRSAFGVLIQFWEHTNVKVNIGPLRYVFITPDYHRVHHSANELSRTNFGGTFSIWDRAFGTYTDPRTVPEDTPLGLGEPLRFPRRPTARLPSMPRRSAREKAWWHAVVREVFAATPVADFDGYFDDLFAFFASAAAWRVDPDAAPLLTRLRTAGVRILVVSNFDARVRGVLAALGLADLVDQITISSEAGAAKPDPRIFATALAAAGLRPSEVLHVGDTAREDLAAARAAGLDVVLVGGDDLAVEAPAATRVPRLADIEAVVARRLR